MKSIKCITSYDLFNSLTIYSEKLLDTPICRASVFCHTDVSEISLLLKFSKISIYKNLMLLFNYKQIPTTVISSIAIILFFYLFVEASKIGNSFVCGVIVKTNDFQYIT